MRKIYFIIALSLFAFYTSGANPDKDSVIINKLNIAKQLVLSNNHKQAYEIFTECAKAGSAIATNAVGLMLQRGWGIEINETESIIWFEKSASMGYNKAYYNLAQIYAKGIGVNVDFQKSALYLKILADMNDTWANSRLGYCYYKGLGVEQNYEKAVELFLKGIAGNEPNAYYFLGLCYRNGYGVDRNDGEAQYYLKKAESYGNVYSKHELSEEIPENPVKPTKIKVQQTDVLNAVPTTFRKIKKQSIRDLVNGNYEGRIITYDYSGKNIVRDVKLEIEIFKTNNNVVLGKWIESDSITADFQAYITDSTLQFIKTSYARTDYYNKKQAVVWNFTKAILEKNDIGEDSYLTGNIQLISEKTKEPEKPMYISLQKIKKNEPSKLISYENSNQDFIVYPNPVDKNLNVSISLSTSEEVAVEIFNLNGVQYVAHSLGKLNTGKHIFTLDLEIPTGIYIVKLKKVSGNLTSIINKK